jgi:CxxC motif-containing protein (DUF1111 family)
MWMLWSALADARPERSPLGEAARARLAQLAEGEALFVRSWEPWDTRAGGDGLGPMYNDTSCLACHARGGAGGAGDLAHNVQLERVTFGEFRLLHRSSTLGLVAPSRALVIERNTPALWGAGLIDAIPTEALALTARAQQLEGPVSGRLASGRFGWRGDTPTLAEFVATACAVELGLSVPGRAQSPPPTPELSFTLAAVQRSQQALLRRLGQELPDQPDLSAEDLAALTTYVASLPRPVERTDALGHPEGRARFEALGCDLCHVRVLGEVEGLYSDLLLHDMGPDLGDLVITYYGEGEAPRAVASSSEWRTPPLWGVGSSAPYLHDGRAASLDEAISAHGGEASFAAQAWQALTEYQRLEVVAFLQSLVAPGG